MIDSFFLIRMTLEVSNIILSANANENLDMLLACVECVKQRVVSVGILDQLWYFIFYYFIYFIFIIIYLTNSIYFIFLILFIFYFFIFNF